MKKLLCILTLVSLVFSLQAQIKEYTITSSIRDLVDSTFNMTIWDGGPQARTVPGKMLNGQIYYRDTTSLPLVIRLTLPTKKLFKQTGGGYFPVKSQSIWLVATPGSTVHLRGHLSDFAEVYPSGDRENEIIASLTRIYHPLLNASVNIALDLANNGGKMDSVKIRQLNQEQEKIDGEAKRVMETFLKKNPSSIAGLYYMNDMLLRSMVSVDLVTALLPKVGKNYKDGAYYRTVAHRVEGNRYYEGQKMLTITSSSTYDNKQFSTTEWKGKFYLIDFWGSWCGPCVADFPALKRLKEAYPEQLRILGIASDKEPSWRKAVLEHQLNWSQILNGAGELDFVARLNVTGFPTKILVDPNGKIVYRGSGGGEETFAKMASIIKKWKENN